MARFENLNVTKLTFSGTGAGQSNQGLFVLRGTAKTNTTATTTTATWVAAGLTIPKNTYVHRVELTVNDSSAATATVAVGDGVTRNGWVASSDAVVADNTRYATTSGDGFGPGKLYSSEDTLDFQFVTSTAATVIATIHAICSKA